jgi:hypothetical protein
MDNVKNCDCYINIPSSQTYGSYFHWFNVHASLPKWKCRCAAPVTSKYACHLFDAKDKDEFMARNIKILIRNRSARTGIENSRNRLCKACLRTYTYRPCAQYDNTQFITNTFICFKRRTQEYRNTWQSHHKNELCKTEPKELVTRLRKKMFDGREEGRGIVCA